MKALLIVLALVAGTAHANGPMCSKEKPPTYLIPHSIESLLLTGSGAK